MDKLRRSTSSDMARLEAAMRKSDLQVASLQKSLDQKVSKTHTGSYLKATSGL